VRFNAKKDAAGKYFSTTIWRFTMYCSNDATDGSRRGNCANPIVIETDPKACEYNVAKGATRKVETYDAAEAGTVEMIGKDERKKIEADPFTKLEHKQAVVAKAVDERPRVAQIKASADLKYGDDYGRNKALRRKFRTEKKEIRIADEQREHDIARAGVPLLPLSAEDRAIAASVRFEAPLTAAEHTKKQRLAIMCDPIMAFAQGSRPSKTPEQRRLEKAKDRIGASWQAVDKKTLESKKRKAFVGPAGPPGAKQRTKPRMLVVAKAPS